MTSFFGGTMFVNLSRDILDLHPSDGVTGQVSSYGRRDRRLPGVLGDFQQKCVDIQPGARHTAACLEGPGLITRIWMTVPRRANPGVLRNLVLRMYWDDETEPSVLTPVGDFFGTTFSRPRDYSSAYLAITSGAYNCFFPMPFNKRALITLENQSRATVRMLFYQVTYLELKRELPPVTPYFHCLWHRESAHRGDPPYTILDARGRGCYIGCHLNMQGRGYPWRLNPVHVQLPEGFGMGMLEGWERIWIDGAREPDVHGTGGEDYFNGAWYFTRVPSLSLTHGVTQRRYDLRRVSCYRFHVEMPVWFERSIRVTIDHGLDNRLPADIDGTSYWYQGEPHRSYPTLPEACERRPVSTLRNRLIMSAPLAYLVAGHLLWRRIRRARRDGKRR